MMGLDVEPGGGVLDVRGVVRGRLFTLGSPQKGLLMETTAVPELRVQARDLASRLRQQKPDESTAPAPVGTQPALAPRHALSFEI
jgi:uncharacterized NAD(P)/FAD-binding protein YdhS